MDYLRNSADERHSTRTYILQQESQLLRDAEKAFWAGDNKAMTLAVIGIGKILMLITTLLIENLKHK